MPITSAARSASRASSSVQQPRAPVRYDVGLADSARWTPVTSCPASTARAAATAESTPPDIAASTRIPSPPNVSPLQAYLPLPLTGPTPYSRGLARDGDRFPSRARGAQVDGSGAPRY